MLTYPVTIERGEEGLVLVTFPDLPEAVICAAGEEAAIARAGEILDIILGGYRSEGRPIPRPSRIAKAQTVTSERFTALH